MGYQGISMKSRNQQRRVRTAVGAHAYGPSCWRRHWGEAYQVGNALDANVLNENIYDRVRKARLLKTHRLVEGSSIQF
jgi:outer membrane receptor for monomeric catechols